MNDIVAFSVYFVDNKQILCFKFRSNWLKFIYIYLIIFYLYISCIC